MEFGETVVIADLEAGIGTLTRLGEEKLDVIVIVVEATPKSLEVGTRAAEIVGRRPTGRLVIVANRVRSDADLDTIQRAFPGMEVVPIPDDPAIVEADRHGLAPLDRAPDAPAVRALVDFAHRLLPIPV